MPKSTLRRGSSALLAVCFVLLATHLSAAASPEPNQPLLLQPEVQSLLAQAQRGGELRVIVRLNIPGYLQGPTRNALTAALQAEAVQTAQDRLAREIGGPNARIQRAFRRFPLAVLEVNTAGLQRLIESPLVVAIQQDVPVPPTLDDTVPHIGADAAWAAGYSGAGQVVAILDTGVDTAHEFLAGKVVAEACFSSTFTGTSSSVCPDGTDEQIGAGAGMNCPDAVSGCYHGTHVAGIAAGSLPASSLYGVARDADLIAIQVFSRFDDEAYCGVGNAPCALSWTSDQIAALEWLHDQTSSYSIAAANMSLGGGENFAPCDSDSRKLPIDQLRADGVATVIASANDGYTAAIGAPACISTAISVGSTTLADEVSFFSNVASFLSLLAPGSSVYSSMPGDSYTWLSGTSMAAPHVSGAWAVIKSYQPLASVDSVLDSLQSTGVSVDDSRSGGTVTDMRRIQVDAAILAIPTVTPTATDTPVASNTPSATPETPTATATPTDTPVPPTNTPTSTATPVPPTDTATPTATFTPTSTPTPTPTSTFTATPTPTDTPTPTATFTPTPTPTNTPVPPTATATATDTPVPPTATPTLTSSPTPSATPDETGDLNLDGVVNVLDVQLAINVFLGTETDPGIAALADVNDDGSVDVLDVQLIIVIYLAG